MMQLGFNTAILPDLDLDTVVDFAAETGYECLEVCCWPISKAERKYAGVTHIDVTQLDQAQADAIMEKAAAKGISFSGMAFYPNILSPDAEYAQGCIDHLLRVMDAAVMLKVDTVNTFIGADPAKHAEHNFEQFAQVWPPIIKEAESRNLKIGIENCPMYFTFDEWPGGKNMAYSPPIWRRMFETIPSPNFGLNYDPSHCVWQFIDYLAPIREFKDRIFHVHAKDLKIEERKLNDAGILSLGWNQPKLPGLGDVNWGQFFSELTDAGYAGPVCVEVEDDAYAPELEKRKASLRVSYNVLKPYFG